MTPELKDLPPADKGARVVFEWMPGRQFLIQRWEVQVAEAPDGIAVIGADPGSKGNFLQHYFDSRGVARVYKMSVAITHRTGPSTPCGPFTRCGQLVDASARRRRGR